MVYKKIWNLEDYVEVLGIGLFQAVAQLMAQMDLHAIYSNCCCSLQFYTQNRIFQAIFNDEKNGHMIAFFSYKSGNLTLIKKIFQMICFKVKKILEN